MTETLAASRRTAAAQIRAYRPSDHDFCRRLWAELASEHQERYGRPFRADEDPGAAFEEHLTRLDLTGMWVADDARAGVVGLVGLILSDHGGEVEPVVVTRERRGEGIGRDLLAYVAEQARRRGLGRLTIAPMARNVDAIHCLHAAGYDALARITLSIDLTTRPGAASVAADDGDEGIGLHGLTFHY
ncbi:MAG TPA: GNAT family N-acetyltransferase [Micromonosporaceae bacterium]|nr:GNAT family N-acetyltransferase [Micromonosporaceae bacterium]